MAKQESSPAAPRRRPVWIAAAAAAFLVMVAGTWWSFGRGEAPDGAPPWAAALARADRTRFRADAWFLPGGDSLGFVAIPAGPVTIGSDPARDPMAFANERWSPGSPQATISLPTFLIGQYEVTVAQFAAFVEATGHAADARVFSAPPEHPAAWVSWPDALAYCRWLEAALRESPHTPAAVKRLLDEGGHVTLPHETEWEKAARGSDGRIYPWGDTPRRDRANVAGGDANVARGEANVARGEANIAGGDANVGNSGTTPVGTYPCPECSFPLFDMSGNVWEWTRSPFQPYPFDPADDRSQLQADALWVMRGGSFNDNERSARAATRGGADPGARRPFIGFRIVVSTN